MYNISSVHEYPLDIFATGFQCVDRLYLLLQVFTSATGRRELN